MAPVPRLLLSLGFLLAPLGASAGTVSASLVFTSPAFLTPVVAGPSGSGSGSSTLTQVTLASGLLSHPPIGLPKPGAVLATTLMPPLSKMLLSVSTAGLGPGALTGAPLNGAMAVRGRWGALYTGMITLLPIPMTMSGTRGVGLGGTVSGYGYGISLTLVGGVWTAGVVQLTGAVTPVGSVLGTTTRTGSDLRTAAGLGTLVLVTPLHVFSNLGPPVPIFAELTLTFVPEPSLLLMLLAPALCLWRLGRERRSR